ncbi:hypothetical protein D4759_21600 [Clostridiales bacterium AHG0011]|uniref:Uncharacterized protein n=1 Tax=Hungatella hathewayi TaxID=154046 RepID=A0A3E4TNZ0_9FIRM|nr:hypothetical protein [Clostridiales bacterium AHG0011]RGL92291.1 hypothetical protein DXC39_32355 [Hungatella hathewayi]RHM79053.1 hypothetical protein DWZ48_13055 [Hungatella hathewayi]
MVIQCLSQSGIFLAVQPFGHEKTPSGKGVVSTRFNFRCKFEHTHFNTLGFAAKGQNCANVISILCQFFAMGLIREKLFQNCHTVLGGISPQNRT